MRCTQVEKLLPLYAGDDVEKAREASEVAAHLSSCADCRLKAEEFEASRRLLALHAPPVFDEAFFAGVRRNVMREIEDERVRPAPLAFFGKLFAPRTLAVAASFALLVACALVASQLYRRAAPPPQQATPETARSKTTNTRADDAPAEKTDSAPAPVVAEHVKSRRKSVAEPSRRTRTARRGASPDTQTLAHEQASPVEPSSPHEAVRAPQLEAVAVNHTSPAAEVAERKLTRIELQTGDPNVRIIWLSPRVDDTPAIQRETKR